MKIKKHLVAATLAVGLVGSAGAVAPVGDSMEPQAGYLVVAYAANNNSAGQAFAQGAAGAAGGLLGATVGKKLGKRAAAMLGARIGATVGAAFGPAGAVLGAGFGAL